MSSRRRPTVHHLADGAIRPDAWLATTDERDLEKATDRGRGILGVGDDGGCAQRRSLWCQVDADGPSLVSSALGINFPCPRSFRLPSATGDTAAPAGAELGGARKEDHRDPAGLLRLLCQMPQARRGQAGARSDGSASRTQENAGPGASPSVISCRPGAARWSSLHPDGAGRAGQPAPSRSPTHTSPRRPRTALKRVATPKITSNPNIAPLSRRRGSNFQADCPMRSAGSLTM